MSDIAILKKMIKDKAIVPLEEKKYGKRLNYSVTLTEPRDSYFVTIEGMPKHDEVIVIKAESFVAPREVFNGTKGECKRADFVIIAETEIEKVILCLEMKKTKGAKKHIVQQLTGAQCFIAYCQEIGKKFWHQSNFLENYKYRFVSIGHISIPKQKTRFKTRRSVQQIRDLHDRPDRMLKISAPHHLQFNRLVEGYG